MTQTLPKDEARKAIELADAIESGIFDTTEKYDGLRIDVLSVGVCTAIRRICFQVQEKTGRDAAIAFLAFIEQAVLIVRNKEI